MKAPCLVMVAAGLAAGSAQAQLVEPATPPQLRGQARPQDQVFSKSFRSPQGPYIRNEAEIPDVKMFGDDYRVDPKLRLGFDLNPYVAIETGYQNLYSRGFHYVPPGRAEERAGALGDKGFASYLAGKLTLPVGERLSAYGKVGVAHSEQDIRDSVLSSTRNIDIGPYSSLGAKYRLNDKASVSAQYEKYGDSANKFGNDTNASGVSAKLNVGF